MYTVIKKNQTRFALLGIGVCLLFFLFGFSNPKDKSSQLLSEKFVSKNLADLSPNEVRKTIDRNDFKIKKSIVPPIRNQVDKNRSKKKFSKVKNLNKKIENKNRAVVIKQKFNKLLRIKTTHPVIFSKNESIPHPIKNLENISAKKQKLNSDFTIKGIHSTKFLKQAPTKNIHTTHIFNLSPKTNKISAFSKKARILTPSLSTDNYRYKSLIVLGSATYIGGTIGLNKIWYSEYDQSDFHYFDDRKEWLGMDKVGHFFSAYYETKFVFQAAHWSGLSRKKSLLVGAIASTLIQNTLEVMDGYSSGWGFSKADVAMNTLGTSIFSIQELLWNQQRIDLKFSATRPEYEDKEIISGFPGTSLKNRAENLFGTSLAELILKDYNAQTLWMSANIASFIPNDNRFPKWLNIAVGYGAQDLYGGVHNNWDYNNNQSHINVDKYFPRYRQFYLSLDLDLTKIKTKSPVLRTALFLLNSIKIPAPTLEYNTKGQFKFIPMHF